MGCEDRMGKICGYVKFQMSDTKILKNQRDILIIYLCEEDMRFCNLQPPALQKLSIKMTVSSFYLDRFAT